jgi:DNA-binding NarL/FixJ family response regulator
VSRSKFGSTGDLVRGLVVDADAIYRVGLAACLRNAPGFGTVFEAASVEEASRHHIRRGLDVVLVDLDLTGAVEFIRTISGETRACALFSFHERDEDKLLSAVEAGAAGYLPKDSLTPEELVAGVRTAARGHGVMAPELLGRMLARIARASREVLHPRGLSLCRLNSRERTALRLVASGLATREVAEEMAYSERTIKNVLREVTVKLGARTRSQAIAQAVRAGLI